MRARVELSGIGIRLSGAGIMGLQTGMGIPHPLFGKQVILQVILDQQGQRRPAGGNIGPVTMAGPAKREQHPGMGHVVVQQGRVGCHQAHDDCSPDAVMSSGQ